MTGKAAKPAAPERQKRPHMRFVPTQDQRTIVELACGFGYTQPQICRLIINPETGKGIDEKTLRENFREELDTGADKTTFAVLNNLYRMAVGRGREAAQTAIFWAKTRAGFKENLGDINLLHQGTVKHDHQHGGKIDLSKLSDAELEQRYKDAIRASAGTQRQSGGKTH